MKSSTANTTMTYKYFILSNILFFSFFHKTSNCNGPKTILQILSSLLLVFIWE